MQQEKDEEIFLIIHLNDRIQPLDRGIKYEDPLDKFLSENNYGEVSGGGTLVHENGEIIHCDVELKINLTLSPFSELDHFVGADKMILWLQIAVFTSNYCLFNNSFKFPPFGII